jgi:hypothetical protein
VPAVEGSRTLIRRDRFHGLTLSGRNLAQHLFKSGRRKDEHVGERIPDNVRQGNARTLRDVDRTAGGRCILARTEL